LRFLSFISKKEQSSSGENEEISCNEKKYRYLEKSPKFLDKELELARNSKISNNGINLGQGRKCVE
jgi:hypothetical protein